MSDAPSDPKPCPKCGQPHAKCTAHKRNGQPCGQPPMQDQDVCKMHGGKAPQALAAATTRHAEREAEKAVATFGLRVDITPADALLELVQCTAGHVAWLRERVQELAPEALVWGPALEREKTGGEDWGSTREDKAGVNTWLVLYHQQCRLLLDASTAALKAGIDERRIKIAEQTGELLAQVIRNVLSDLTLTPDQQALVSVVVPRHLRAVAGGAA